MTTNQQQILKAIEGLDAIEAETLKARIGKLTALQGCQSEARIKYLLGEAAARLRRAAKEIRRTINFANQAAGKPPKKP